MFRYHERMSLTYERDSLEDRLDAAYQRHQCAIAELQCARAERNAAVHDARACGITWHAIADRFGVARSAPIGWLTREKGH